MNRLTEEEFTDRMKAIQRAHQIFIESGLTNNITTAFKIYQDVFAERERELFLNARVYGNRTPTILDRYERPKCPDCSSDMLIRELPENNEGVKTQLVCTKCDVVLDTDKSMNEWIEILEKKNV